MFRILLNYEKKKSKIVNLECTITRKRYMDEKKELKSDQAGQEISTKRRLAALTLDVKYMFVLTGHLVLYLSFFVNKVVFPSKKKTETTYFLLRYRSHRLSKMFFHFK